MGGSEEAWMEVYSGFCAVLSNPRLNTLYTDTLPDLQRRNRGLDPGAITVPDNQKTIKKPMIAHRPLLAIYLFDLESVNLSELGRHIGDQRFVRQGLAGYFLTELAGAILLPVTVYILVEPLFESQIVTGLKLAVQVI
jgi:hypothetical protein